MLINTENRAGRLWTALWDTTASWDTPASSRVETIMHRLTPYYREFDFTLCLRHVDLDIRYTLIYTDFQGEIYAS